MYAWIDDEEPEYTCTDPDTGQTYYGATQHAANSAFLEALRVRMDHLRKNPTEIELEIAA